MPTCKFSLRLISPVLKEFIETIREQFKKNIFSFSGNFIYSHNPFFWWFIGIVTRKIYVGHFCWPKMKWLSIPRVPKNIYQFATVIYWVIHNRESFMPQTDNKTKVLWKGINKDYSLWRSLTWIISLKINSYWPKFISSYLWFLFQMSSKNAHANFLEKQCLSLLGAIYKIFLQPTT